VIILHNFVFESSFTCPVDRLWQFHSSAEALAGLALPGQRIEVISDSTVREGAVHILRITSFGLKMEWHARIHDVNPPFGFSDTATQSPFASWRHHHQFVANSDGSILRDEVCYTLPYGRIGKAMNWILLRHMLKGLFAYRHRQTKRLLERR
jgi:ligand-binding SRPBCC domain-containing protein